MNKVLLLKKKGDEPYIRKNGFNYTVASIYCCVNKDNQVTDVGFLKEDGENGYLSFDKEDINQSSLKKFVSKSSLKNSKSEDRFIVFITNDLIHLDDPLFLEKKVRGCRFAENSEIEKIKRRIVIQYVYKNKITHQDMFYQTESYNELYRLCMEYDLISTLFDLESEGFLYKNYWEK